MKKWLSALLAALMLLGLAGCGSENPPAAQDGQEESSASGSEEESPNDCENLVEGGICIEKFEKNLKEMGYDTSNRPEDWDDNIILVEASKNTKDDMGNGDNKNFTCMIRKDGSVKGAYFGYYVNGKEYEDFSAEFSKFVEEAYADICKADPNFANSMIQNYVPVSEELFAKYPENKDKEYSDVLDKPVDSSHEVSLSYSGTYGKLSFFYHIIEI